MQEISYLDGNCIIENQEGRFSLSSIIAFEAALIKLEDITLEEMKNIIELRNNAISVLENSEFDDWRATIVDIAKAVGCCKYVIRNIKIAYDRFMGDSRPLEYKDDFWWMDDIVAWLIIKNYSGKKENNTCKCGRHGRYAYNNPEYYIQTCGSSLLAQYDTKAIAISHVQGQQLVIKSGNVNNTKILVNGYCYKEPIWCDVCQLQDFDALKCRKQYDGVEVHVYDISLIGMTADQVRHGLCYTTWASRGWTWQEAYLSGSLKAHNGKKLIDISQVSTIHRKLINELSVWHIFLELVGRGWTYKAVDIMNNVIMATGDSTMTYSKLEELYPGILIAAMTEQPFQGTDRGHCWLGEEAMRGALGFVLDPIGLTTSQVTKYGIKIKLNMFQLPNDHNSKLRLFQKYRADPKSIQRSCDYDIHESTHMAIIELDQESMVCLWLSEVTEFNLDDQEKLFHKIWVSGAFSNNHTVDELKEMEIIIGFKI